MQYHVGDRIHGFTITRVRAEREIGGELVEARFERTGTPLIFLNNGAENKLFSVTFRTLPENGTGVFHILEHSVLCGSEKYPVREPFVELLKSSMNTFLNAMTFPDKTVYPISSRNRRDYLNLASVYLDAVFAPKILTNPSIFFQEGRHLEEEDGKLSFQGVVLNEMKGAMSSVEELCAYAFIGLLYPDTCYGFNYGGEPSEIPKLTLEQFRETYRRFYHPSNAIFYLDGDVPLEETLEMIESYLKNFDREENLPVFRAQEPKAAVRTISYELSADEPMENRVALDLGKIIPGKPSRAKLLAIMVLKDAIAGSNEAPLKRAVLSENLAQEMEFSLETGIYQPYFDILFKNVTDGKEERILPCLRETVQKLLSEGLSRDALQASVNRLEFRFLEPEEPQALERMVRCMDSALYGGDPMRNLVCAKDFEEVRRMIAAGEMEEILRELLLEDEGLCVLRAVPSRERGEQLRREEEAYVKALENPEEEKARSEEMKAWQHTPDTPEQLSTLPVLPIEEVSREVSWVSTEQADFEGARVLFHPLHCPGLCHVNLYFPLTDFSLEELSLLSRIAYVFTKLPTARHGSLEMQQEIKTHIGSLYADIPVFAPVTEHETCAPYFQLSLSVLEEKLPVALELTAELLLESRFDDREKIREMLVQQSEQEKLDFVTAGHLYGVYAVLSHYTAKDAAREALEGRTALRKGKELLEHFEEGWEALAAVFEKLRKTFTRARAVISVGAEKPADVSALLKKLPLGEKAPRTARYELRLPMEIREEIPAGIGYAVEGLRLPFEGKFPPPALFVASKIISLEYLWNEVRVRGGAYGTGFNARLDGSVFTYSFRDPTPEKSLRINGAIVDFLREFLSETDRVEEFIISTVAANDPLLSPREEAAAADANRFMGLEKADKEAFRSGLLSVTRKDLLAVCDILADFSEKGAKWLLIGRG